MDGAKTAVAHDQHLITTLQIILEGGQEGIQIGKDPRLPRQHRRRVPAQIRRGIDVDRIGPGQAVPQSLPMHPHFHGVGARFQYRHQPRRSSFGAQGGDGGGDGGGVVGEIVIDGDAVGHSAQLQATAYSLELAQSGAGNRHRHPGMAGGEDGGQGVLGVECTGLIPGDPSALLPRFQDGEGAGIGPLQADLPGAVTGEALHRRPAAPGQDLLQGGRRSMDEDLTVTGDRAQQVMKLGDDGVQIRKNIGVIVFEIVEDEGARVVVDEFGAFVEKGGIILIGLDDKEGTAPQTGRDAKIQGFATDEKTGLQAGVVEYPGEHRRRARLAVSTGHRQHPAALKDLPGQPGRAGVIGQGAIQHRLDGGIAPGQGITDQDQIGCRLQVRGIVTVPDRNPLPRQQRAHGRIGMGIGTADLMPRRPRQQGNAAHEGSAGAEDVDMHGRLVHGAAGRHLQTPIQSLVDPFIKLVELVQDLLIARLQIRLFGQNGVFFEGAGKEVTGHAHPFHHLKVGPAIGGLGRGGVDLLLVIPDQGRPRHRLRRGALFRLGGLPFMANGVLPVEIGPAALAILTIAVLQTHAHALIPQMADEPLGLLPVLGITGDMARIYGAHDERFHPPEEVPIQRRSARKVQIVAAVQKNRPSVGLLAVA